MATASMGFQRIERGATRLVVTAPDGFRKTMGLCKERRKGLASPAIEFGHATACGDESLHCRLIGEHSGLGSLAQLVKGLGQPFLERTVLGGKCRHGKVREPVLIERTVIHCWDSERHGLDIRDVILMPCPAAQPVKLQGHARQTGSFVFKRLGVHAAGFEARTARVRLRPFSACT